MPRASGGFKTTFDARSCIGCATCEMACSYHHEGHFQPSISSIEISGSPKEGFKVSFYAAPQEGRQACDGCRGLEEPCCLKCCPPMGRNELKALIEEAKDSRTP